jgi:hypothetical protein
MKAFITLLIATCTLALFGWAQEAAPGTLPESYIALMRSNVQTRKTEIIQQALTLTDDQERKFWPLQRSYENDLSKLGDRRVDIIRDYTKNWDNLSDETAKNLGKRLIAYHKKRIDLRDKYFARMSKEISPTVAAKFFQIETQLEDIVDLAISSSLPLVK